MLWDILEEIRAKERYKLEKNNSILKRIEGKGFGKTIWSPIGRAMHTYNMVEPGGNLWRKGQYDHFKCSCENKKDSSDRF